VDHHTTITRRRGQRAASAPAAGAARCTAADKAAGTMDPLQRAAEMAIGRVGDVPAISGRHDQAGTSQTCTDAR